MMRFRTGFCVVYNLKRGLIMDGRLIAHFYIFHDTFFTDLIAACPAIVEVRTPARHTTVFYLQVPTPPKVSLHNTRRCCHG